MVYNFVLLFASAEIFINCRCEHYDSGVETKLSVCVIVVGSPETVIVIVVVDVSAVSLGVRAAAKMPLGVSVETRVVVLADVLMYSIFVSSWKAPEETVMF